MWALDFVGSESWDNVGWPTWWLEIWGKWVNAQPGRRLILAVPILAGPPDGPKHDSANHVAFQCYFDINESDHGHQLSPGVPGTGKKEGTEFPLSAAKFRELFGAAAPK